MIYIIKYDGESVIIKPRDSRDLMERCIAFWEAEIFTGDGINSVSYRFNMTGIVNKQQFESLAREIKLFPMNERWGEKQMSLDSEEEVDSNFRRLLEAVKIEGAYSKPVFLVRLKENHNPPVHFDIKKESKSDNDKVKVTFRLGLNIYPESQQRRVDEDGYIRDDNNLLWDNQEPLRGYPKKFSNDYNKVIRVYTVLMLDHSNQLIDIVNRVKMVNANPNNRKQLNCEVEVRDPIYPLPLLARTEELCDEKLNTRPGRFSWRNTAGSRGNLRGRASRGRTKRRGYNNSSALPPSSLRRQTSGANLDPQQLQGLITIILSNERDFSLPEETSAKFARDIKGKSEEKKTLLEVLQELAGTQFRPNREVLNALIRRCSRYFFFDLCEKLLAYAIARGIADEYSFSVFIDAAARDRNLLIAEKIFREACSRKLANHITYGCLMYAAYKANNLMLAKRVFETARLNDCASEFVYNALINVAGKEGDLALATSAFETARTKFPTNKFSHNNMINAAGKNHKLELAKIRPC